MRNDLLEKALEETWKNKDTFYENTKGLSMLEVVSKIENKYKAHDTTHGGVKNTPAPKEAHSMAAGGS